MKNWQRHSWPWTTLMIGSLVGMLFVGLKTNGEWYWGAITIVALAIVCFVSGVVLVLQTPLGGPTDG